MSYPGPQNQQYPPFPPQPPTAQPPKRKFPWMLFGILALFVVGSLAMCGVALNSTVDELGQSTTQTEEAERGAAKATSKPKAKAQQWKDGTYKVGEDIKPGTYKSPGAADSVVPLCYADTHDAEGTIRAQEVVDGTSEPVYLVVKAADGFVTIRGCKPFVRTK